MFLADIVGDVTSTLHWKDIVASRYRISLLFLRTAFNAVICLYFRVNRKRKKISTTIYPERSIVFDVLLERNKRLVEKERYKPSETGTVWNNSL